MVNDTLFLITCSKTKQIVDGELPLCEMYTGNFHNNRKRFIEIFDKDYFYCTPSGPGVVKNDFKSEYYDMMTSHDKLISEEFQNMHRKLFDERYPDLKFSKIAYLGATKYIPFLKGVFKDKKLIYILDKYNYGVGEQHKILAKFYCTYEHPQTIVKPFKILKFKNNDYFIYYKIKGITMLGIFKYDKTKRCFNERLDVKPTEFLRGWYTKLTGKSINDYPGYKTECVYNIAIQALNEEVGLPFIKTIDPVFIPRDYSHFSKEFVDIIEEMNFDKSNNNLF